METDGEDRDQLPEDEPEAAAPPPRNPFAEEATSAAEERPALIRTKRSAAVWGIVAAIILSLLVGCICIMGSIAFAG